jgi:hypothetical protein
VLERFSKVFPHPKPTALNRKKRWSRCKKSWETNPFPKEFSSNNQENENRHPQPDTGVVQRKNPGGATAASQRLELYQNKNPYVE